MNLVEITVRTKDDATSQLKKIEGTAKDSGAASGKGFSQNFSKQMGGGLLGGLFGKSGSSSVTDAQRQGQNVGMGLARGILQKFNSSLGSGLLSGLFGTSGGGKLFGNAGNTVVQDAAKQGQNIAQGLGKGLNDGFASSENKVSGVLSGLFSKSGSTASDAQDQGSTIGRSFTKGLSDGFSKASGSVTSILSGLFGGAGSGPDESAGEQAGKDTGDGFLRGFANALSGGKNSVGGAISGLLGGGGGKSGEGGALDVLDAGGVAGGALPGIMGISGKTATIAGIGGSLLGALPALAAVGGAAGLLGAGAGVIGAGAHALIGQKNTAADPNAQGPLYNQAQAAGKALQGALQSAAAGMLGPLKQAFGAIPGLIKAIEPGLKAVFAGAGTLIMPLETGIGNIAKQVLPLLGEAFKALAPLIAPLLSGLGGLLKGILPALVTLFKAAAPAIDVFAKLLSGLGHDIGGMLGSFAPVLRASSVILGALGTVINAIFPVIGKLAATLATALAPAFSMFAAAIAAVLPGLTPLLSVLGEFAGAVVTDLAGVLGAVATLIKDLAPSFATLATAMSGVFTVLENSGVFAVLGDALENLAGPLANLINALVKSLAPALPALVAGFADISAALIKVATVSLGAVIAALTDMVKFLPPSVLQGIAVGLGAIWLAQKGISLYGTLAATASKLFAAGMGLVDAAMDANPIMLVAIALAAIGTAFYIAWQKSAGFRDVIKTIGAVMVNVAIVILAANRDIVVGFLDMVATVVQAAADAFGWVPGLGGKLKGAAKAVSGFKDDVSGDFNKMIGTLQDWRDGLEQNNSTTAAVTAKMQADFAAQKKAAEDAKTGITDLTLAIQSNGANSQQAKAARDQLITDLKNAGVNADTAKTDVDAYSDAVAKNGANSQQAAAARKQLISDILAASKNAAQGAKDLATYTTAVKNNGASSDAAKAARAKLITDLENCGLSAKAAGKLVDGLTTSLDKVPKNTKATVSVFASGGGGMTFTEKVASSISSGGFSLHSLAGGGLITDGTTPTADDVLARLSKGEAVVPAWLVPKVAPILAKHGIPGFASGGIAGMVPWADNAEGGFVKAVEQNLLTAELAHLKASVAAAAKAKAASAAASAAGSPGPGGGAPAANAALARKLYPPWASGPQWTAWNNVAMRESGWNQFARNPSSGAYGIPQAYPASKMGAAANPPQSNPTAQINWMVGYIKSVYGTPEGAWHSELVNGAYANGGATSAGWATVGEHGRELIKVPGGAAVYPAGASAGMAAGGAGPVHITLELGPNFQRQAGLTQQQLSDIRYAVRTLGGGSVQKALGIGSS